MKVQHSRSTVGWAALAYGMALLSTELVGSSAHCTKEFLADGWCDNVNNNEACDYDGGDCCKESCALLETHHQCGVNAPYNCLDPDYLDEPETSYSYMYSCEDDLAGNGHCDSDNNNENCGYDGGDCCFCTCSTPTTWIHYVCGEGDGYDCVDPDASCVNDGEYVEAGTVTTVTAAANAFDTRYGEEYGDHGCMNTGCVPELTRDGDTNDPESRWACRQSIVPYHQKCQITFWLKDEQDIRSVQVAFKEAEEYPRALDVKVDGEHVGVLESSPEKTFTSFSLDKNGVYSVTLTTSGLNVHEWIHILEVRILVEKDSY